MGPGPLLRAWMADSLSEGSALAIASVRLVTEHGSVQVLIQSEPATGERSPLNESIGLRASDADLRLTSVLEALVREGSRTILVEDDLSREGDPQISGQVAFLDGRVVRWHDLRESCRQGADLARTGASGYPLNAFVSNRDPVALGLSGGQRLDSEFVESFLGSISAIVVAVHDAETYVVWQPLKTAEQN